MTTTHDTTAAGGPVTDAELRAEADRWRQAAGAAFAAESASRRRGPHTLGLSAIGGCTRRAAYAIAGTPPSDDPPAREGREANLGTYQHTGLLPRLAGQSAGSQVEVRVTLRAGGLELHGSIDLDDPMSVVDLKTVGAHKLHTIRRTMAPFTHNRLQGQAYALARLQAGRPPRFVTYLYLDRASGDLEPVVKPFTNRDALEVVDRAHALKAWSRTPDEAPRADADGRHESGPGRSFSCDECWFLRRCWGMDAVPGRVGAQTVRHDPQVIAALADYDQARADAAAAEARKADALAKVAGAPYGRYGPWRYFRQRPSQVLDAPAAVALLAEAGERVPWKVDEAAGRWVVDVPAVARRLAELGEQPPYVPKAGNLVVDLRESLPDYVPPRDGTGGPG